jgi:hypothetical protein
MSGKKPQTPYRLLLDAKAGALAELTKLQAHEKLEMTKRHIEEKKI